MNSTKKLFFLIAAIAMVAIAILTTSAPRTTADASDEAAALYKAKCVGCHAADGSGNTAAGKAMKVRDLSSAEVQAMTDEQLYEVIAKGKGKMPGYEKSLGADKCKALVGFVRTLKK